MHYSSYFHTIMSYIYFLPFRWSECVWSEIINTTYSQVAGIPLVHDNKVRQGHVRYVIADIGIFS